MPFIESFFLYFQTPDNAELAMHSTIEPWLLLLSFLVAFASASLSLFDFGGQEDTGIRDPRNRSLLLIGSVTLGGGIWAMHMVAMLALAAPEFVRIGVFDVLLSSLPVLGSAYLALKMLVRPAVSMVKLVMAGTVLATGTCASFYIAMLAKSVPGTTFIDIRQGGISFALTAALLVFALWLRFRFRLIEGIYRHLSVTLSGGAVAAIGVVLGHYVASLSIFGNTGNTPEKYEAMTMAPSHLLMLAIFISLVLCLVCVYNRMLDRVNTASRLLKMRESVLDTVTSTSIDAMIAIDQRGTIFYFNRSAERIFGWLPEEVIGKNIKLLVTDEHKHKHDGYIQNFIDNKNNAVVDNVREVNACRKDGSVFPVRLAIGHTIRNNQNIFVGVLSDISEQRHMAWALKENAKQYRSLISNLPGIAFREMTGGAGQMVYISDAAKPLTGFSASALTGENGVAHFHERIHGSDIQGYRKVRDEASRLNGPYDCEYRFLTKSDKTKWFWEIGQSYRAEDGSVWIDGLILDITENKNSELEMREAKLKIEQATQSKESFLANMSYEFRTPMNSILGLADILLEAEQDEMKHHHLEVLKESGLSLMKLLNDILDTSKLESREMVLDVADFSLIQLCRQIEFIARESTASKEVSVSLHYDEHLWDSYVGDGKRLKQLLQNMVRSALDKTEQGQVALYALPVGDSVRFSVAAHTQVAQDERDDASGEQVKHSQNLSATLVTQLIELMKGNLWFDGEENNVVIYADIPLVPAPDSEHARPPSTVPRLSLPPLEVVVIDDVQRNQQELRDFLLQQGMKVLTFNSVETAMDVMQQNKIDLILLDGYQFSDSGPPSGLVRSWAAENGQSPILLALTLEVDATPLNTWQALGFDGVITKPLEPFALRDTLKTWLVANDGEKSRDNVTSLVASSDFGEELFDEQSVFERWPTTDILACVVLQFRHRYQGLGPKLSDLARRHPGQAQAFATKAARAAGVLGFDRLHHLLCQIVKGLETEGASAIEGLLDSIPACFEQTLDKAYAYLGIRAGDAEAGVASRIPEDEFFRQAGVFTERLQKGQFDEVQYKVLLPWFATFVESYDLVDFVGAIDDYDFDEAYTKFTILMDEARSGQHQGVSGYGV